MTDSQKLLIGFVNSSITGKSFSVPQDADIKQILEIAKSHRIENMVYYGLVNCGCDISVLENSSFGPQIFKNIYIDQKQSYMLSNIIKAFNENNIDYCLLKGAHLKSIYPKSDMRSMADIDILIKTEQYNQIRSLLLQLGYLEGEESLHEFIWTFQNYMIEFHKSLIPPNNKDFYPFFGDGWSKVKPISEDSNEYVMTNEDEYIFLITHIAKHFRDSGIGIKCFVDLWIYKNKFPLDTEYLHKKLEELKLLEFYKNIEDMLNVWFNGKESTELSDYITTYIFDCAVFGTRENQVLSSGLLAKKYGTVLSGKILSFFRLVFPDFRRMTVKYPILKKAPYLLPFLYVARWFEAVLFKRDTVSQHADDLKYQTDDKIKQYEEALKYMGLEYHFEDKP